MQDLRYYIALSLLNGVGPIIAKNLISYCGSIEAVFEQSKGKLLKIPGIGPKTVESMLNGEVFRWADLELEFIEKNKIKAIPYSHPDFPKRMLHCGDCPILIYSKGKSTLNAKKCIAIVGTRKASPYGKEFVKNLISELKSYEVQIISGMALGIDAQAHRSAIDEGLNTLGVLANPLNTIYPPNHHELAIDLINSGGSLVSEYPSQNPIHPSNFPMRNRIIVGMSDATIVAESDIKGGAVISAHIANSYNRDVFALPGRYKDRYSKGCNYLIKTNKAQIIESAQDLIKQLSWDEKPLEKKLIQKQLFLDLNENEKKIVAILREHESLETDLLMVKTDLNGSKLACHLLELELKGIIQALPGNRFILS